MTMLQEINLSVSGLRAAGCHRDGGIWLTRDGAALSSDPVEAFRQLKREQLRSGMEQEMLRSGGKMTREYTPNASR